MIYQLKEKITGEVLSIYGVEHKEDRTFFLCHTKEYKWSWIDSSYLEPLVIKELDLLK